MTRSAGTAGTEGVVMLLASDTRHHIMQARGRVVAGAAEGMTSQTGDVSGIPGRSRFVDMTAAGGCRGTGDGRRNPGRSQRQCHLNDIVCDIAVTREIARMTGYTHGITAGGPAFFTVMFGMGIGGRRQSMAGIASGHADPPLRGHGISMTANRVTGTGGRTIALGEGATTGISAIVGKTDGSAFNVDISVAMGKVDPGFGRWYHMASRTGIIMFGMIADELALRSVAGGTVTEGARVAVATGAGIYRARRAGSHIHNVRIPRPHGAGVGGGDGDCGNTRLNSLGIGGSREIIDNPKIFRRTAGYDAFCRPGQKTDSGAAAAETCLGDRPDRAGKGTVSIDIDMEIGYIRRTNAAEIINGD